MDVGNSFYIGVRILGLAGSREGWVEFPFIGRFFFRFLYGRSGWGVSGFFSVVV